MITHGNEPNEILNNENNISIADITENEKDKKILEPEIKPNEIKKRTPYTIGEIIVDKAYLMEEPDEYSEIISMLKKGDAAIIESDEDKLYYKVTANIKVGYILKSQIKIK